MDIFKVLIGLYEEYEETLKEYYKLGGTADFLERSGIKKTYLND